MIDGHKAIVAENLERLRRNPLLDFIIPVSKRTGEIVNRFPAAYYKGLSFTDKTGIVQIDGSFHNYFNDGFHNHNDFCLDDLKNVVNDLEDKLNIDATQIRLANLEVGVNIELSYCPELILRSLILHRSEIFTFQKAKNKSYRECSHTQYYIKMYDKGLQYGLSKNILRAEVKFIKMEQLNNIGIFTYADLTNHTNLTKLKSLFFAILGDIVIGDCSVDPVGLNGKDKLLFMAGHNPEWWNSQKPDSLKFERGSANKEYRAQMRKYNRKLQRFEGLLSQTGASSRKKELINLLDEKFEKCLKLTNSLSPNNTRSIDTNFHLMSKIDQPVNNGIGVCEREQGITKLSKIDRLLYNENIRHLDGKRCLITKLPIWMQKEDSKFLCTAGIKYYLEHHPKVWIELQKRLSLQWKDAHIEKQIEEIHHSIRNEYLNPINYVRNKIMKLMQTPSLFDNFHLITQDKLKLAGFIGSDDKVA